MSADETNETVPANSPDAPVEWVHHEAADGSPSFDRAIVNGHECVVVQLEGKWQAIVNGEIVATPESSDEAVEACCIAVRSMPAKPPTRTLALEIPQGLSNEQVQVALRLGMGVMHMVQRRHVCISYPVSTASGFQLGQAAVAVAGNDDVTRILTVASRIHEANIAAASAMSPADQLTASVLGRKAKDAAVQQATGGIVIP